MLIQDFATYENDGNVTEEIKMHCTLLTRKLCKLHYRKSLGKILGNQGLVRPFMEMWLGSPLAQRTIVKTIFRGILM